MLKNRCAARVFSITTPCNCVVTLLHRKRNNLFLFFGVTEPTVTGCPPCKTHAGHCMGQTVQDH